MAMPEQPASTLRSDPATETGFPDGTVEPDGARPANHPVPTWVWVTIALLAVVLGLGLAALSFSGGGGSNAQAAVADVQQLMKELTTLNASLATTNAILADAIQSSSEISAKANAKLEQLSANLAGLQAGIGQARATMGPQLKSAVRTRLGNAQAKLQSHAEALAQNKGQLSQQALNAVQEGVGAVTSKVNSEIQSRTENKASLESQIQDLRANVDLQAAAQERLESRLGNVPGTIDQIRSELRDRLSGLRDQVAAERVRLRRLIAAGPAAPGPPRSAAAAMSGLTRTRGSRTRGSTAPAEQRSLSTR